MKGTYLVMPLVEPFSAGGTESCCTPSTSSEDMRDRALTWECSGLRGRGRKTWSWPSLAPLGATSAEELIGPCCETYKRAIKAIERTVNSSLRRNYELGRGLRSNGRGTDESGATAHIIMAGQMRPVMVEAEEGCGKLAGRYVTGASRIGVGGFPVHRLRPHVTT